MSNRSRRKKSENRRALAAVAGKTLTIYSVVFGENINFTLSTTLAMTVT